ncbi:MAG TPA: SUMF1/EgtB/PvdO family nonheme iron enzyme [Phycisphaerae bacterium]|nr:SUMF1/EgtB/PvdO family nonheme iron enzyme [Phycisphaerae bacterium]
MGTPHLSLEEVQARVREIVARGAGMPVRKLRMDHALVQDLNLDSLAFVELIMEIEDAFGLSFPDADAEADPTYKAVFTRPYFSVSDLAELTYLRQGTPPPQRRPFKLGPSQAGPSPAPFTQLGGRLEEPLEGPLLEALSSAGPRTARRRTDGMICMHIPAAANVSLGSADDTPFPDEHPPHDASLSSFIIDREPVSTTAYARFLNSISGVNEEMLHDWFLLTPEDKRRPHELLRHADGRWKPAPGTERFPMVLVSWFGANAYGRWANRMEWRDYRSEAPALPTEAQWEYAARGTDARLYPWGNAAPDDSRARFGLYRRGATYEPHELPLAEVQVPLGVSPFGLHHMAGNVWQWCRDWYDGGFYQTAEAAGVDPANRKPSGIRAERGGSWIGPAFLCRSSYRRGRSPAAKGRCLGFRCLSVIRRSEAEALGWS